MDKNKYLDYYKAKALNIENDIFYSTDETPSHKFIYIFISKNDFIINIAVRDFLDINIISKLSEKISKLNIDNIPENIQKIQDVNFVGLNFNSLMLLPPSYHIMGYEDTEEIPFLENTIIAFPIYHCEFSGNETPDEIKYMRRDIVSTIDWNREITPKIKIRYKNFITKSKTVGNRFYLSKESTLINEINDLKDDKSFIELENYSNKIIVLKSVGKFIRVTLKDEILFEGETDNVKKYVCNYIYS